MDRWSRFVISALAAVVVGAMLFSFGFWAGGRSSGATSTVIDARGNQLIDDAYDRIERSAVDPPAPGALARGAIKGMVEALKHAGDPYALYYNKESFQSFQELSTGTFSGIGVWLDVKHEELQVLSVLPDSPALEAGMKPGDVILQIDGDPVSKMTSDEAVARIKGPEGTDVKLSVRRDDVIQEFVITRRSITFPNLRSHMTGDKLGYVHLITFARGAGKQLRDAVGGLIDRGARGIVLDLRDNGGGLFTEGIQVASVFIEDGVITTYSSPTEGDTDYEAEGNAYEDIPVVVLVNGRTASASEIVTGALQDTERAIVVGSTTFGKGSVQEVIPLPGSAALKLTTAAYLTPDGTNINGKGIEPDVEVSEDHPDLQKKRAMEILNGIISDSG
ncbi:MAG TPA: S41 family peptidase [Actinomycetota bacterium]|nr:S41 family peptidase [Actinomycetota bacterium]